MWLKIDKKAKFGPYEFEKNDIQIEKGLILNHWVLYIKLYINIATNPLITLEWSDKLKPLVVCLSENIVIRSGYIKCYGNSWGMIPILMNENLIKYVKNQKYSLQIKKNMIKY